MKTLGIKNERYLEYYKPVAYCKIRNGKYTCDCICSVCGSKNKILSCCEHCGSKYSSFITLKHSKHEQTEIIEELTAIKDKQLITVSKITFSSNKGNPIKINKRVLRFEIFKNRKSIIMKRQKTCAFYYETLFTSEFNFIKSENYSSFDSALGHKCSKVIINSLTKDFKYMKYNVNKSRYYLYEYIQYFSMNPKIELLERFGQHSWIDVLINVSIRYKKNLKVYEKFVSRIAKAKISFVEFLLSFKDVDFFNYMNDSIIMLKSYGKKANINLDALINVKNIEQLKKVHDRLVNVKTVEQRKKDAREFEEKIKKYRFAPIQNNELMIVLISSLDEMAHEGNVLQHCVFKAEYYKKKSSLIFSARKVTNKSEPIETLEYDLSKKEIVQCRGKKNLDSKYHNQILELASNIKNNLVFV